MINMTRFYLGDRRDDAWISVGSTFGNHTIACALLDSSEALKGHPRGKVQVFNKATQEHETKEIFRVFKSHGKVPSFDPKVTKSYMHEGEEGEVPSRLKDVLKLAQNLFNPYFNQVTETLYEAPADWLEPHSDCSAKMIDKYSILVFGAGPARTLDFFSRATGEKVISIPYDSTAVHFGQMTNELYRHGVSKGTAGMLSTVSLSFRAFK